jgi:hypothetical protein
LEIQGRQRTAERAKMPMIIPISDFDPPCFKINKGKRKKAPKLETVNRLARAMVINVEL